MADAQRPHEELLRALEELAASKAQLERALGAEKERARRDPLTGVLNHGSIVDQLHTYVANNHASLALVMIDLDDLKATNDTYGHQVGDAVLKVLAQALQRRGAIVGRYGGDEFLAIVPGATRAKAERYRDEILEALAKTDLRDPVADTTVPVSASIGLAIYPEEAETVEDLIKLSDSAMYAKKQERPASPERPGPPLDDHRVAKLLSDILPLLTAPGSREDKLRLVAHRLSVGVGYDGVNFEVAGPPSRTPTNWERSFARAPEEMIEAWLSEQRQAQDHPLGRFVERKRRPVFLDPRTDRRLTDRERRFLTGAGFRSALVVPMIWQDQFVGMLSVGSNKEAAFTSWDAQFLTAVSSQVTAIVFMTTLVEELKLASADLAEARAETVMMLAATAEAHDETTGRHLQGVRALTESLALELGHSEGDAHEFGLAAVLHDLGKIRVPEGVLTSSGRLGEADWELMKHHTTWGGEFLAGRHGFELMATIARHHHERWDGTGYPDGLTAEAIPEPAAIVAVADSFDAITSDRPYRRHRSVAHAVQEIVSGAGIQFSPSVVDALVRLRKRNALPRPRRPVVVEKAA
jgi:diguanylate cyclase (GGDEF)-like protein